MRRLLAIAAVGLGLHASSVAHAIEIARDAGADNLAGAVTINSVTIDNVADTITIDIDVLKLHTPFEIGFTVTSNGGTVFSPDTAVYRVKIKMKHAVPLGNAAHEINGFDIELVTPAADPFVSLDAKGTSSGSPATSDVFAVEFPNLSSGFRFGGLNGGGPTIGPGDTANSELDLVATSFAPAGTSHGFTLKLTANPEPASLLLGAMVVTPCGIAVLRRRRKKRAALESNVAA